MIKNILTSAIFVVLFVVGNAYAGTYFDVDYTIQVPEPGTLLLLASGAASVGGVMLWRWKKK